MTRFRRLVLELGHGAADPETIRQATAFAHLVDVELHALFVEDETLLHASALPFAREISPLSCEWRPMEPDRLEAELRSAAERVRRQLIEVTGAAGVRRSFEVRRGDLASHVTDICVETDIVVLSPPRRIGAGATHGSGQVRDVAHRSLASVLFLPPRTGPARGLVVVIAMRAGDPGLEVARRIATQGRERLLVLAPMGIDTDWSQSDSASSRILLGTTAQDMAAALGDARERLIVMSRVHGADDSVGDADLGAELAAARGVPVLVVEPV